MTAKLGDNLIEFRGTLPITTIQEDGMFISFCSVLDNILGEGLTFDDSITNFHDALMGTIIILREDGKLESFLNSCGWSLEIENKKTYIIPPFMIQTSDYNMNEITSRYAEITAN